MEGKVLLVDDKPERFNWLSEQLDLLAHKTAGLRIVPGDVRYAQSGPEALELLDTLGDEISVAVVDLDFSGLPADKGLLGPDAKREGLDIARAIRGRRRELPVYLFTFTEGEITVGDPLTHIVPFEAVVREDIASVLLSLLAERSARAIGEARDDDLPPSLERSVGAAALRRMARSELPLLILGETGTGKTELARWLHRASDRRGRLETVDCTQWPSGGDPNFMAAALFGQARGAFAGAAVRVGACEAAHNGTLFLDEVAELRPEMQAMLMRAVKEGIIRRLGEDRERSVSFRLISATNRPLEALRADLLHRISAGPALDLAPLRERPEDIAWLAARELRQINARRYASGKARLWLDDEAIRTLEAHEWPGNGHELARVIGSAAVAAADGVIGAAHVPLKPPRASTPPVRHELRLAIGEPLGGVVRRYLLACWCAAGLEAPRAADLAQVGRATMWRTLRATGLELLAGAPVALALDLPPAAVERLLAEAKSYVQRLRRDRVDTFAKANELGIEPVVLETLVARR